MISIPDPENIPQSEQAEYLVASCAARLYRLKNLNAPALIIEREKRILQRRIAELPVYSTEDDELNTKPQALLADSAEAGK